MAKDCSDSPPALTTGSEQLEPAEGTEEELERPV